ncbi:MAG: DUF1134 domain-containing protein [OCS116 cluster bacterium]|uniref:DUF1134 domain-containing protein n=1 Tax=OCS116 cluster bacterium TaxID=2030921 RepID=A0A2A4Z6G8_9PROT|nr:DUF1134 domain-containing protein [OCS116 cluster bacterium]
MQNITKNSIFSPLKTLIVCASLCLATINASAAEFSNNQTSRITEDNKFQANELIEAGHVFFGGASANIASVIESMFSQSGKPTAYIIGEEGSGSLIIGVRYGEGYIYFKDGTRYKIFWQGPSVGFDFGADASKTMVLVYGVNDPNQLINRFPGVDGSAYVIGGLGISYQQNGSVSLGVIRTGVGARLGVNVGYLKYSAQPDWNPF